MRYPAHIYAKALIDVIKSSKPEDEGRIIKNFTKLIQNNGDETHSRKIIEETARLSRKNSGTHNVVIESARAMSSNNKKGVANFIKPGDTVIEKINPELIAGTRIVIDDEMQLDGTLKGKLDKVFENI